MYWPKNIYTCFCYFCVLILIFSCEDHTEPTVTKEFGTISDIDGNSYKTVKIGNQWWMAENLKVSKFRNGTPINQSQDPILWQNETPAYCIYENNKTAPGYLYNYYAVNDSNQLAPVGWHIPTDEEWKTLETFLGMSSLETDLVNWRGSGQGDKLKIEAPQGWIVYNNIWGTNESGFSALAGSCRLFNGVYGNPGLNNNGFWWSSSENKTEAWYRHLDYKTANVFRYFGSKNYGFSVRCIKD